MHSSAARSVLLALTCVRLRAYERTYGGRSKADSVSHSFHGELGPSADADADADAAANADSFLPPGADSNLNADAAANADSFLPLGAYSNRNADADAELELQLQLAHPQPQPQPQFQPPPLPRPVPPPRRVYAEQFVRLQQVTAQLHSPPHIPLPIPLETEAQLPYGAGSDATGNERDFFPYQQVGATFEPQPPPAATSQHSPSVPSISIAPLGSYTNPQLEFEADVGLEANVRTERPRGPPPPPSPPQAFQSPAFAAGFTQPGAYLEAPVPQPGAYLEALVPQPQSVFADDSECVATEI